MESSVQNVFSLLLRSGLLPVDTAREMYQRWGQEAGQDAANLDKFSRWVVTNDYLTEYQLNLLKKGHSEGFFLSAYRILDRLGKGRMAGVYKAKHELGQVVAIKVLPPSKAKDPLLLGRFQREAQLALRLKHPNIVRAFQVGEVDGLHHLVMEYLEGETLDEVLTRRGQFPPAEAVRLVHQALEGLQHIHEQGLVHRDLKPANLMLVPAPGKDANTSKCMVKILDIGLGRAMFDDPESARGEDAQLTSAGTVLGTPDYMSPEQARDARSVDIRSDIYSLGCVLYHLLAGRTVFPDTNVLSQMIRHAKDPPQPLRNFNPAVPDGLQQIVNWMLAKDPAQRYPTPQRAAQALQVFLAAEKEPVAALDDSDSMRSYLSWVEKSGSGPVPAHKPQPAQPDTGATTGFVDDPAAALPPTVITAPLSSVPTPRPKPRDKARPRKDDAPAPPAAKPVAASPFALDPSAARPASAPAPAASAESPFRLSWRDLIMFGIGVGGTCIVFALAFVASRLIR